MADITLLSIRAEAESADGVLHYGGRDLAEAIAFMESLPDGFHSLSVSFSAVDDAGQAHMLTRQTQQDEGEVMQLYDDAMDWLHEMGGNV